MALCQVQNIEMMPLSYRVISLNCPLRLSFYLKTMSFRTKYKIFLSSILLDFLLSDFNILLKWKEDLKNVCHGKASFLEKSVILRENLWPSCTFFSATS